MSVRLPPEFEGFFASARQGHLSFPYCNACGKFHWYPMKVCPHCRSPYTWSRVAGPGTLHSWTVVRHPFVAEFADKLPYFVGLVKFDDAAGVRFITNVIDVEPEQVFPGMAVEPVFPGPGQDPPLVMFRPRPGN